MNWRNRYYALRDYFLPFGSKRRRIIKNVFKPAINKIREVCDKRQKQCFLKDFRIEPQEGAVILTTKHCEYIAKLFKIAFDVIKIPTEIIFGEPQKGYKNLPHIVICPQMFKRLPEIYASFQMEQSVSSRWFTKQYFFKLLRGAIIFDYSLANIAFLQKNDVSLDKVYYLPISWNYKITGEIVNKEYDVVFYGDTDCSRREKIISELKETFNVKAINGMFGDDLYRELKKAKVIINIHYYEGALLETTRIYECLSLNSSVVISEKGTDMIEQAELSDMVDFVEVGDVQAIKSKIDYYLHNEEARKAKLVNNLMKIKSSKCTRFEYYFYRFLLASDNISFEQFYDLTSSIELTGNFWCLGLPEATERYRSFREDNKYGITYFPGLRHSCGWIGCGLSYKYLLKKAVDQNLRRVTICEDDVDFSASLQGKLSIINKYLDCENDWDIFSGVIADVADNTQVLNVDKYDGETIVTVNKIVSMAFNVYNQKAFSILEAWDNTNMVAETNTIDRFIESNDKEKYLTTVPFLVRCKNELNSTLWGFDNSVYDKMIAQSEKKLAKKVEDFLKEKEL